MRNLLLLVLGICFYGPVNGQSDFYGGVFLRAEYERSTMENYDLNDFFRSYNDYYAGVIPQPFDTLLGTDFSHFGYGTGIRFYTGEVFGFAGSLFGTYGVKKESRTAIFQNDITTQADFRVRDMNIQIDLGVHIYRILFLQGHLTGRFRKTVLDLGYFYQDGSYSIGDEYEIIGVYSGLTTTLDVGGSVGIKLGPVFIPVSISFPTNMFSDGGLITLLDYDKQKTRWSDLPRDYKTWADDPANVDLDNGFVRMESLQSVRINIGIEYIIGGGY
ncbi:MAG: hypothetical protein KDC34_07485 [Saprospiraceae bacterium]|nr:hypothetical protein [Saprospiraceae bacterium]